MVLSRGNTMDYAQMYRGWAGHDPSITPYLEYYGLPTTDAATTVTPAASPAPMAEPMAPAPAAPATAPMPQKGERGR
jgi:hypothetical protein